MKKNIGTGIVGTWVRGYVGTWVRGYVGTRLVGTMLALSMVPVVEMTAQDDFGLWGEVNVEKKLNSRWSTGLGVEFRSRDNVKEADRWSLGADVSYKITDWLKASAGYTLLDDHRHKVNTSGKKYADYWGLRHRVNVSLTASHQFGRLGLSLRERWQYTYRPEKTVDRYWNYTDDDDDRYKGEFADTHTFSGKSKHVWRQRLQLKYKIDRMWRPYLGAETSISTRLEKIRYSAGTEIRIDRHHSLNLEYIFQDSHDDDDEEGNRHVIGLGYTFKF